MTTTAAPDLRPDRHESEERPILRPVPVHTTPAEPEARSFADMVQTRRRRDAHRIGIELPADPPLGGYGFARQR